MSVKKKTVFQLLGVAVVLLIAGFFSGLFSITAGAPPSCVFTDTVKTCTYNYTLESSRAASVLLFDFDGGAVSGTALLGGTVLQPTSTYTFNDPSSSGVINYNRYYMYEIPSTWAAYDLVVNLKGTDTCTATSYTGDSIRGQNSISAITKPWASNQIVALSSNNAPLTPEQQAIANFHFDTNKYSTPNVYEDNQQAVGGIQTVRCYKSQSGSNPSSESQTNPYDYDSVIPNSNVYAQGYNKFIVRAYANWRGTGGSIAVSTPVVKVSYHESFYPSNVAYKIGNLPIETFSGLLNNGTRTSLDIADQVNLACNRGFNSATCTVPITITSATPGNLWVSTKTETLKVASQDAVITELQGTLQQKIDYINQLDASIEEKASIIAQLEATQEEQVLLIDALNLSISDQAIVINELTQNLAEKAYYVSQLQVENSEQAALVRAMRDSFANQGVILDNLNKTVAEDAVFISQLSSNNVQQAEIIAGMQSSLDEEKALTAQLRAKVADQEALLAQVQQQKNNDNTPVIIGVVVALLAVIGSVVYVRRKK